MTRRIITVLVSLAFLVTFAGAALSGQKGNPRKGKYLFRKQCRSCHKKGASAKELSPSSKTQAQWKRAFRKDKYQGYECHKEWKKLSEKDLLDIFTYVHSHAIDSPAPAKCK